MSTAASLLSIKGAKGVTVAGLGFEACRGTAVRVTDSDDVTLSGVTVRNAGAHGVHVTDGLRVRIEDARVAHTGGMGVFLEAGDKSALTPAGHAVVDSVVHHWERLCLTYNPALRLDGVGNAAVGNLLYSAPHHAIEPNGNNLYVARNVIHHASCDAFDNGAIYWAPTDWTDYNVTLEDNVVAHTGGKPAGLPESEGGTVRCNAATSCMRVGIYADDGAIGGAMRRRA